MTGTPKGRPKPRRFEHECYDCGAAYTRTVLDCSPCETCGGEVTRVGRKLPTTRIHVRLPYDVAEALGPDVQATARRILIDNARGVYRRRRGR